MIPEIDKTIYQRPVELLQQLIQFDTSNPPGNERECVAYINQLLDAAGIKSHLFSKDPHRPNLVARLNGEPGSGKPALMLYGHVDVVPAGKGDWRFHPFSGKMADGFIWGRGALDMKGAVAMMVSAFMKAKIEGADLPGDVVLCILSDEEKLGEFGARFMVEKHADLFKGVRCALGEFGGFTLYVGGKKFYPIEVTQKQVCGLKAIIKGPSGHGSFVMRGGAMARLAKFLDQLDKHLLPVHVTEPAKKMFEAMADALPFPKGWMLRQLLKPGRTDFIINRVLGERGRVFLPLFRNTVNATIVRGGESINVIPGEIEVEMDVRLLPGFEPDDVIRELRPIIGRDVELELLFYDPGPTEMNLRLFDTLASILKEADPGGIPIPLLLTGVTDARFFSRLGISTCGFTPMQLPGDINFSSMIHAPNERIPVESLEFGSNAIFQAMQRFC
jgi:acetylornithine deacetylase/succinyl-diaminopimelate desuccinylase-like protein